MEANSLKFQLQREYRGLPAKQRKLQRSHSETWAREQASLNREKADKVCLLLLFTDSRLACSRREISSVDGCCCCRLVSAPPLMQYVCAPALFCVSFEASKKRLHTARQRVMIGGKEVVLPVGSYTASYVEKKVAEESQVGEPEQSPSGSQEKGWKKAFKKVKLVEMATDGGLSQNARTRARPVSAACTFHAALHAFDAARTLLSMTTYIFGRLMLLSCLPLCGGTGTPL